MCILVFIVNDSVYMLMYIHWRIVVVVIVIVEWIFFYLVWFGLTWFDLVWFGLDQYGLDWIGLVCVWFELDWIGFVLIIRLFILIFFGHFLINLIIISWSFWTSICKSIKILLYSIRICKYIYICLIEDFMVMVLGE